MYLLIVVVLLLMIVIGFSQVVIAIIMVFTTKQRHLREHYGYYLGGVTLYFALLFPLIQLSEETGDVYGLIYFFSGALGLMVYHFAGLKRV